MDDYAGIVRALAWWAQQSAENLAALQTQLAQRIAELGASGGATMTSFTVPGQSATYQISLPLVQTIAALQEAIQRAQGGVAVVRRTSARFLY